MKGESHQSVPCPKRAPAVIGAADDEDGDGYQPSAEGDESTTPTLPSAGEAHQGSQAAAPQEPGVNLKQAVSSGVCRLPLQPQLTPGPDKDRAQTALMTAALPSRHGEPSLSLSLADRLGKRKLSAGDDSHPPLKRSLAERLGKKVEAPETSLDKTPKKVQLSRSLKDRLGVSARPREAEVGEIRVKTLEEILLERATQKRGELQATLKTAGPLKADDCPSRTRSSSAIRVKTFSEVLAEKNHRQQETQRQEYKQDATCPKIKTDGQVRKTANVPPMTVSRGPSEEPAGSRTSLAQVHIKTLEEIKLEKALRAGRSPGGSTSSQPPAEATRGTGHLLQIARGTALKEEKEHQEGSEIASQSRIPRTKAGETSGETTGVQTTVPGQRCETPRENPEQKQQERGASQTAKSALMPLREDAAPCGTQVAGRPVLTAVADVTRHLPKRLPAESCRKMEGDTSEPGDSVQNRKCAVQALGKKGKAKPGVSMKPSGARVVSSARVAPKRKAVEMQHDAAATMMPLRSTSGLQASPAKKVAVAAVAPLSEDKSGTGPATEKPRVSFVPSPSQCAPDLPSAEPSGASSSGAATRPCQVSAASTEPQLCVEDDLEKLLQEIAGDSFEAEIDLEIEKDEDELLRELSELIDS